jgi:hypothetical protein
MPPENLARPCPQRLRNQRDYVTLRYVTILRKPAEPGGVEAPR